jgi:hypothetical protein
MQVRNRGRCSKNGKKFEKELASLYDAYWHGQDVNTNEYMALVYRAAAYGIDTGKLPPLPKRTKSKTNDPDSLPDQK